MSDVLLTLYCAAADGELIADHIGEAQQTMVHLRNEQVFGRDFADASPSERVMGQLRRCALEVIVPHDAIAPLVASINALGRAAPVRWHTVPILSAGRLS
ncbi:DUF3240 family protein [Sphingopyxis yananensis]|uniref:DUF3240 family protein n=1 Tax=Sphingopyxis yananensis TaxID=2886687 RepID=UPI001D122CE0|nr:DUF3240 family protein [Sphingopyxis yananensis]MCC2601957.1 DUF3240 family protein [Sphingopyxis yananensis]